MPARQQARQHLFDDGRLAAQGLVQRLAQTVDGRAGC
jgi:hypothetical protein